ncbi:SH3 domain-containing protein, partial [mine drainage metagenome]
FSLALSQTELPRHERPGVCPVYYSSRVTRAPMPRPGTRVRVTRVLPPSTRLTDPPLVARPGAWVTVLERSDEWPRFLLVRTARGEVAWVPERILGAERPSTRVRRAFDSASLAPELGAELEVLDDDPETGWFRGRASDGSVGWYAAAYVDEI